jgi:hypothetical protein
MTTDKTRITAWLYSTAALDDLVELARRSVPIEQRGRITRSTCIEAAIAVALAELRRNGAQSGLLAALVTLPRVQDDPQDAARDGAKAAGLTPEP